MFHSKCTAFLNIFFWGGADFEDPEFWGQLDKLASFLILTV